MEQLARLYVLESDQKPEEIIKTPVDQRQRARAKRWQENYIQLLTFYKEHGHCRIPHHVGDEEYASLYSWLGYQRRLYKNGKLPDEEIRLLTDVGVDFSPTDRYEKQWTMHFQELKEFRLIHGHVNVPTNYPENRSLASWCMNQRQLYWNNNIRLDRMKQLKDIGFRFEHRSNINDAIWEQRFLELQAFHAKHGHCNISTLDKENGELARWVSEQRSNYAQNKDRLTREKIARLADLGFVWSIPEHKWNEKYQEAVNYQNTHGHIHIPLENKAYQGLNEWFKRQRQLYKQGLLSNSRIKKLEELGFSFDPHRDSWEHLFSKLCRYLAVNNTFTIASYDLENQDLVSWIRRQRKDFKNGVLSQERINKLNVIGFEWKGKRGRPKAVKKADMIQNMGL